MTTKPADALRLRLGTRRSPLALAQSGMMARALEVCNPGLAVELVPMVTTGDVVAGDLAKVGGKGLFTQELEKGLLDGSLDLAVHSLKDLPVHLPAGLTVAAYPERADPRDVLVSELAEDLDGLPEGAVVLTGALRRRAQILLRRPDLRVEPIRGNVDTRLRKWREQGAGAVILAGAGLSRLGLTDLPAHPIPTDVLIPAPGQGILALEVREGRAGRGALPHPRSSAKRRRRPGRAPRGGRLRRRLHPSPRCLGTAGERRPPPHRPPGHPRRHPRRPRRSVRERSRRGRRRLRGGLAGGWGGGGAGAAENEGEGELISA